MTAEVGKWPVEYSKELLIGNPQKPVAICSLWSERNHVAGKVGLENVAVVGNLYSHGPGVEGIVRNVLANPAIRGIVIAGKDKSQSAETLKQFSNAGVEKTEIGWTIPLPDSISEDDLTAGMRTIDESIPYEEIEKLRTNVEIRDLRGKSWPEVGEVVAAYEDKPPFAKPAAYPKTESKIQVMRSEDIGYVFRGSQPEDVWLEILRTIRKFGSKAESRYTSGTQEVLNVMGVLDGDLDKMMKWPYWVGQSPASVRKYSEQLIKGEKLDEEDTYAYGERMRVRKGDQIGALIKKMKEDPYDRGYLVDLWDVETDFMGDPDSPPCLTQAWFRLYRGRLSANFSYRSHDMFSAWIKNAMGDRLLHNYVSEETGIPLGPTTIISCSAHIYDHDFKQLDGMLESQKPKWRFVEDPRGNFIVDVDGGQIVVRHENRSGAVTTLRGMSAERLYKDIWSRKLVLLPDHAMYIGYELARAEASIREDREFEQDRA
jgi:thymidylate synthase